MAKIRTFTLQVPVNYDLNWAEAIRRGAPNTPADFPIWKVGDQFPTETKGVVTESLTCVQLGPSYYLQAAEDYAKQEKRAHAHPRAIWAIGEHHPKLAKDQGESWMFLNSGLTWTVGSDVLVPRLDCRGDGYREARVGWARDEFRSSSWFVFRE